MSRPPYKPTSGQRERVNALAAYGTPEAAIARVLRIDPKTLRKHFRLELDTAHIVANSTVAQSLYNKCTGNGPHATVASMFWLKCRAGWKEKPTEVEVSGNVNHKVELDVKFSAIAGALDLLARGKQGGAGS